MPIGLIRPTYTSWPLTLPPARACLSCGYLAALVFRLPRSNRNTRAHFCHRTAAYSVSGHVILFAAGPLFSSPSPCLAASCGADTTLGSASCRQRMPTISTVVFDYLEGDPSLAFGPGVRCSANHISGFASSSTRWPYFPTSIDQRLMAVLGPRLTVVPVYYSFPRVLVFQILLAMLCHSLFCQMSLFLSCVHLSFGCLALS
jgi:hypothetical protein